MRIHSGEKPHQCKCCDKKLRWGFSRSHKLGQCKKIKCEKFKLKCEDCNFLSVNQSILKLHALSHQISLVDIINEKPSSLHKRSLFQNWRWVPGRSKDFLDNSSVKNSEFELLTSNHKELTIECIKCEKRLSSNRSLKRLVHEPEKSYESRSECKKCGNNLHTDSIRKHWWIPLRVWV